VVHGRGGQKSFRQPFSNIRKAVEFLKELI
jgi:hypothetical protein